MNSCQANVPCIVASLTQERKSDAVEPGAQDEDFLVVASAALGHDLAASESRLARVDDNGTHVDKAAYVVALQRPERLGDLVG